ncbi:MAG: Asp-tRNA(Asn)/Glu-tRNA(Gln) amidotransferase subunit GatC [Gemmatimonadetes bacterium]|nr:Asp-tRNA(Asn)/Glu-tRNA(Gln) amidotransferase subunit GatC [Gemmatimonadota bacterium]
MDARPPQTQRRGPAKRGVGGVNGSRGAAGRARARRSGSVRGEDRERSTATSRPRAPGPSGPATALSPKLRPHADSRSACERVSISGRRPRDRPGVVGRNPPLLNSGIRSSPAANRTERNVEPLSAEEVRHIARLTRLGLGDDEVERMRVQLADILAYFQSLAAVDTEGVEPTGHSTEIDTVMRDDVPAASLDRQEVLENAPDQNGEFFRVPRILD